MSRSSGDRGRYFVNSHHGKYRWTLYIWHGALSGQMSKIDLLGFVWKCCRETGTTRRGFIPSYKRCLGETAPRCAVPAALPSMPLAGNSHITSKYLKLGVTNHYAFVCSDDNITLKLPLCYYEQKHNSKRTLFTHFCNFCPTCSNVLHSL